MRRRYLSDEELNRVIKLKHSGASWLKIQTEIGVPRRSAKRAYDDWQNSQSIEELKAARTQVATEEFRDHLGDLIALAEALVGYLPDTMLFNETKNADRLFEGLWIRDIGEKRESFVSFGNNPDKERRRIIRQNQMLFESLKTHTRERVRWQAIEDWKQAWNACFRVLESLRADAKEIVGNILNNQKPNIRDNIEKGNGGKNIVEEMIRGVVEASWRSMLEGKPEEGYNLVRTREEGEDATLVLFGDPASITMVRITSKGLAEEVERICKWATKNLCKGDLVQQSADLVKTMQTRASEIEVMLDPLMLRPLILRTRCDLCPA